MSDRLYIAWRYLACHRIKTIVLVASITLIVYLPVGLRVLVGQSQRQLTARAEATPLLVGAKGSPLELALNSLYFNAEVPALGRWSSLLPEFTSQTLMAPFFVAPPISFPSGLKSRR